MLMNQRLPALFVLLSAVLAVVAAPLHANVRIRISAVHARKHCLTRLQISVGEVRFGSGSGPFALNPEPEPGVRFRKSLNLEPEPAFRFGSAFERVRT